MSDEKRTRSPETTNTSDFETFGRYCERRALCDTFPAFRSHHATIGQHAKRALCVYRLLLAWVLRLPRPSRHTNRFKSHFAMSGRMNNTAFIAIKMGRRAKSQIDSPPRIASMVHEKNRVNCLAGGLRD
jgi:hypothetical protein